MHIETRSVESVFPYAHNPRQNDGAVDAVAKSIQEFGFRQPIVVDADGVIVVGHTRWKAAKKLGLSQVPVHVAKDLSPEKAKAYRLADNQTGSIAEWDKELLPLELIELKDLGIDLSVLGWNPAELGELLAPVPNDGLVDPDDIPSPPPEAKTKPQDLWILGNHRLLCGDSAKAADVDRLLAGQPIHLVNSDPPYNVTQANQTDSGRRLVSYYVSQKAIKQGYAACPIKTINSEYIDALVRALVLKHLKATTKRDLEDLADPDRDYWVREVIGLVELGKEQLVIDLVHERVNACVAALDNNAPTHRRSRGAGTPDDESIVAGCAYSPEVEEREGRTRLKLAVKWRKWNGRLALTSPEGGDLLLKMTKRGQVVPNAKIVETIGLAYAWHEELLKTGCQIEEVAEAYGVNEATVRKLLGLTFLAPREIQAILGGAWESGWSSRDVRSRWVR